MSMLRKALVLTAATLVSGAVFAATTPATPATPAHHANKHAAKHQHHVVKHAAKKVEGTKAA